MKYFLLWKILNINKLYKTYNKKPFEFKRMVFAILNRVMYFDTIGKDSKKGQMPKKETSKIGIQNGNYSITGAIKFSIALQSTGCLITK